MISLTAEWIMVWLECNIEFAGLGSGMVCTAYGAFLVYGKTSGDDPDYIDFEEDGFSQNGLLTL